MSAGGPNSSITAIKPYINISNESSHDKSSWMMDHSPSLPAVQARSRAALWWPEEPSLWLSWCCLYGWWSAPWKKRNKNFDCNHSTICHYHDFSLLAVLCISQWHQCSTRIHRKILQIVFVDKATFLVPRCEATRVNWADWGMFWNHSWLCHLSSTVSKVK